MNTSTTHDNETIVTAARKKAFAVDRAERAEKMERDSAYGSSSEDEDNTRPAPKTREHCEPGLRNALVYTATFYVAVLWFLFGGSFTRCPVLRKSPQAKAQVYSLCMVLWMWHRPHYRTGSYQDDMLTNLRNVAIPGTGLPLSLLVRFKLVALLFLFVGYPVVSAIAGVRKALAINFGMSSVTQAYSEQLLLPQDWFSFWRLNCVVASYHSVVNRPKGFQMEDKWTFLQAAKAADVPISPCLDAATLVVKDKNEEGGMGIHFFKNALHGGSWILQPKLSNDHCLASLLPEDAPLSTLRVITASRGGMRQSMSGDAAPLRGEPCRGDVEALSCVFRAGRGGAMTDHDSILFDVDMSSGMIRKGTTNMHWYQLGPDKIATTPWLCLDHTITHHPDSCCRVTGHTIPDIAGIRELCEDAHFRLLPDVPLAGWDVALTKEAGRCLLEVNLSCNFFRGAFDQPRYFQFVNSWFDFLDDASRTK